MILKKQRRRGVMVWPFNPSTWWISDFKVRQSIALVSGQPRLLRETLSQKNPKTNKTKNQPNKNKERKERGWW